MKVFGLVEMTSGLVHLGYSLPKGQAGKLNFFVPCLGFLNSLYTLCTDPVYNFFFLLSISVQPVHDCLVFVNYLYHNKLLRHVHVAKYSNISKVES